MAEEKQFENKIKKLLKDSGAYIIKYWGGGEFTKSGVPDLLVCLNGRFMGIEIKATRGKPSELQLHNLKQIQKAGGIALLLYPTDFPAFQVLISNLTNTTDAVDASRHPTIMKDW